jgi:hypothetical protein
MIPGLPALAQDFLVQESNPGVGTVRGIIANQDSTRWAIIFASLAAAGTIVTVSTLTSQLGNSGLQVGAGINPIILNYRDHGPLVQQQWSAIASVGGQNVAVMEIFYRPRGISTGMPTSLPDEGIQL